MVKTVLSSEDLARWQMAVANKELADNNADGLGLNEKRDYILHFYRIGGEFAERYNLSTLDGFEISVFTGEILTEV